MPNSGQSVCADYQPHAQWRWSGEVDAFMADALDRSYCRQYRETDFDFNTSIMAEECPSRR